MQNHQNPQNTLHLISPEISIKSYLSAHCTTNNLVCVSETNKVLEKKYQKRNLFLSERGQNSIERAFAENRPRNYGR